MAAVGSGEPREPKTVAKEEINATLGVSYNSPVLYTSPPRSNNIRQPHSVAKEKHEEQGNKNATHHSVSRIFTIRWTLTSGGILPLTTAPQTSHGDEFQSTSST